MGLSNIVEFNDIEVLKETHKAILVNIEGEDTWIPKSVIHENSEVYEDGTSGTLIIGKSFAKNKGLID